MYQHYEERTELPSAEKRVEDVAYDPYEGRRVTMQKTIMGIYLVFGIIEGLIAIRFFLRLFGANPNVPFADFIYTLTAPFVAPFIGLFGTPQLSAGAVEWHSLVAILIYAILAALIVRVIWLLFGETRHGVVHSRDQMVQDTTKVRL